MFGLGKKKKPEDPNSNEALEGESSRPISVNDAAIQDESGIFARLKSGLSRTRSRLSDGLAEIVLGEKTIDLDLLEEIETQLLSADIGIDATDQIIDNLKKQLR